MDAGCGTGADRRRDQQRGVRNGRRHRRQRHRRVATLCLEPCQFEPYDRGRGLYICVRPGGTAPNGIYGNSYGYAVAVSDSVVLAGAPGRNNEVGSVTAYTRQGSSLTHPKTLTAANGQVGDSYGSALAFDGSTLFVAAPFVGNTQGAVYVYSYKASAWTLKGELMASDG